MVAVLLAVAATIALAGYLIPSGLAADYIMMSGPPDAMFSDKMATTLSEYARYDADSVDFRVQAAVVGVLMLYWEEGSDAFETITPEKALITNTIHPLVLYVETFEVVAHGALPDLAGVIPDTLTRADSPVDIILADLERDEGIWVEYTTTNPANGILRPKRSRLYMHDGCTFCSDYYI